MNKKILRSLICSATLAFGGISAAQAAAVPDPDMQVVLDELAKLNPKPLTTLSAKEARKQPGIADAAKKVAMRPGPPSPKKEPVGDTDSIEIPSPSGHIKARVYTPKGDGPFPVIVYYHGGGWVIATIDTYDSSARALVNEANAVVVSVEYRKGPEAKFPAAHDDALTAYKWVWANLVKLKGAEGKVAVAGESAGGNLAASVAIAARDEKLNAPVYQLLVYPVTDYAFDKPSYTENADAKPLNKDMMKWFFDQYATPNDAADPRLSILRADLKGLPPATVITDQIDPLMSDGSMYADKLKAAGVTVDYKNFDGVTHEFFGLGNLVAKAKEAEDLAGTDLKAAFAKSAPMSPKM